MAYPYYGHPVQGVRAINVVSGGFSGGNGGCRSLRSWRLNGSGTLGGGNNCRRYLAYSPRQDITVGGGGSGSYGVRDLGGLVAS
jgi:hypothetical protein